MVVCLSDEYIKFINLITCLSNQLTLRGHTEFEVNVSVGQCRTYVQQAVMSHSPVPIIYDRRLTGVLVPNHHFFCESYYHNAEDKTIKTKAASQLYV